MTASSILQDHLPITSRNVKKVAALLDAYVIENAPRIMAQRTSDAKREASRHNGRKGGRPRKDGKPNKNGVVRRTKRPIL